MRQSSKLPVLRRSRAIPKRPSAKPNSSKSGPVSKQAPGPLKPDELRKIDAYWRAANYLSVGQIYLLANPLLKQPLKREHVKPRLLGHWGTTPSHNFIYVHLIMMRRQR